LLKSSNALYVVHLEVESTDGSSTESDAVREQWALVLRAGVTPGAATIFVVASLASIIKCEVARLYLVNCQRRSACVIEQQAERRMKAHVVRGASSAR
ncbi:MAG: hypothetical protein ABI612_12110, partial [Betaproteobacteria bacterium]